MLERTRFLWTPVWGNEAGRSDGIGNDSAEERPGRGGGDGGGGAGERGATRAVECAGEDGDRAATLEARRGAVSPGTQRRYAVTLICATLHAPRSSVYAAAGVARSSSAGGKRGPKTVLTDAALLVEIRAVLAACPFHSEGHRKVHFRL